MTYEFLQSYWWFLVSLLGALLVFLMFVQGANTLIFCLGKTEEERRLIINSTGQKVGVHLHHARHLRRSLLRLVPIVLQHQFRRSLLAVDDHPVLVCDSSREL